MPRRPSFLPAALTILLAACSSNGDKSAAGGSHAGQTQASSDSKGGQGGQSTSASGGSRSESSGGNGGQSTKSTSGAAGNTGGKGGSSGVGGSANTGGTQGQTSTAGGTGGSTAGAGGNSTSRPQVDASDSSPGGTGGSSSASGGASGRDAGTPDAAPVGHPRLVLLGDEGNQKIHLVDLQEPTKSKWTKSIPTLRDMQLVGNDRLAVSVQTGYIEIDVNTGETKKEFNKLTSVETIRRLPNGNTVFGGNSDGGITLQELDSSDQAVPGHKMTFTGASYGPLRQMRRTPQGTFLIGFGSEDSSLAEVNWDKQIVWQKALPDAKHTYQGLRLPDNTIAVAIGYGAAILIVDYDTKDIKKTIGGKSQPDAASISPNFYAGFQILPNGNFVVANWQAHGAGNGNKGIQLLEYDPTGKLVWSWKQDANLVSSLFNVMVLDGLDTKKLHDDVNGILAPVTQ